MMMSGDKGSGAWFDDKGDSTFNQPDAVKGIQFLINMYQKGYAPKDSVNWGFNEIVAGFYSGSCAMLDQDPDALIAIAQRMEAKDFAVAPMPFGPSGKAFPTIGYAGWASFASPTASPASARSAARWCRTPRSRSCWPACPVSRPAW